MPAFEVIPDFLKPVENEFKDANALNDFRNGKWVSYSSSEVVQMVHTLALGFQEIGIEQGEAVGLYAPSSVRWVIVDLAILIAGGITVPIFANISHSGLEYIIEDAHMKSVFVEGEQNVADIVQLLSRFERVLLQDATHHENHIMQLEDVMKMGAKILASNPEKLVALKKKIKPEDLATYIYTSGSTGSPKGVELTHRNLVSQVVAAAERFPVKHGRDVALSCLPLAHIFERMVMYYYFSSGVSIYFADDVKNLAALLPTVKPTLLTVVPRLLEKVQAGIITKARAGSWVKRTIALKAFARANQKIPESGNSLLDRIYDKMVYSKIRKALGGRIEYLISGGSALSADLCRFYLNIGIPVFQGYGMTECSPVIAASYKGVNREGYVGPAFPGVTISIAETGEILVKGPGVMRGYHLKPEATAAVIDSNGWFHTGDKGEISPDGLLKITGRIKEIFKTSNGKYVSPVKLEQLLISYYLIDMAMIIGENRKFVSCILFLEPNQLTKLKEKAGKLELTNQEFINQGEIFGKIDNFIQEMNKGLDHWEQIQKFHIVAEVLSIEDGSLTPTMKIRRHVVLERYKNVIEKMYEEK